LAFIIIYSEKLSILFIIIKMYWLQWHWLQTQCDPTNEITISTIHENISMQNTSNTSTGLHL